MFRRGLALCAVLGFVSVANAGIAVNLTPTNAGPYDINNPASLGPFTVNIDISQSPAGSREGIRLVRFDLADTNPAITLPTLITWRYTGVTGIPANAAHAEFRELPRADTVYQPNNYPNKNANDPDFFDDGIDPEDPNDDNRPWNFNMLVLPASGNYRVASLLNVRLPAVPGEYLLDVMNSDSVGDVNSGAQVTYGFGIDPNDPRLDLRANEGALSGGQLRFIVIPEPATLILLGLGGVAAAMRRRSA
jgi:hypothetical protein